jgi:hypothetical protein
MKRILWSPDAAKVSPDNIDWTVTVTEPLPNCPSIAAAWERIATQTKWGEWRSESKMRGKDVTTTIIPRLWNPSRWAMNILLESEVL